MKEQALAEIQRIVEVDMASTAAIFDALADALPATAARPTGVVISCGRVGRRALPHAGYRSIVLRVFYYLGGTLVFAGLGIYIQTVWHDLTSPAARARHARGRLRGVSARASSSPAIRISRRRPRRRTWWRS
jgi:hypothetical protein